MPTDCISLCAKPVTNAAEVTSHDANNLEKQRHVNLATSDHCRFAPGSVSRNMDGQVVQELITKNIDPEYLPITVTMTKVDKLDAHHTAVKY